jgi:hypothetical protein
LRVAGLRVAPLAERSEEQPVSPQHDTTTHTIKKVLHQEKVTVFLFFFKGFTPQVTAGTNA